ncbi:bifunctional phosphopantothenoylcysteine decarboxylase/phosphopantothenate synthase (plasmid) [Streptomyces sp. YIM 121038]|uniref:flavoprotein n=1 Tax=Streptomyces sp. YIM 121038 TaxID=2136401 RepID=UPI00111087B3|nr:flavoprotein [Streptomyces sp. YIM 121038]QCX82284.1 bifunctional phosphopantothenoylcysteine decarboxylase/phosphopantothenate synthase [Streptomyces sp. YIM 121038]
MTQTHTLYLIACAAPPARRIQIPIRAAQKAGWDVCVILTPSAYRWASEDSEGEIEALEQLTGHPVRWQYKLPSQADVLPPPDAMLVAPLTSNTLNKWAGGISDTLALGLITEAIGMGTPLVALPHWNDAQGRHPAVGRSVQQLREAGVEVLLGESGFIPHRPRHGDLDAYPWHTAIEALPAVR